MSQMRRYTCSLSKVGEVECTESSNAITVQELELRTLVKVVVDEAIGITVEGAATLERLSF